jgi:hypothetical protein
MKLETDDATINQVGRFVSSFTEHYDISFQDVWSRTTIITR